MQQALAANQAVLKETQASVVAMSIRNKETEARMATMECMMAQLAAQSGMAGPGQPSRDQLIHPPLLQRTGDAQSLEEEDEEDNPMFTPQRSNAHKATVAAGPEARQTLSPSANPPHKISKPATRLTDGDRDMSDQRPHEQTGQPGTSGIEGAEKC